MDQNAALDISRQALQVGLMVSLPGLAVALFIGVAVSIFQAVTQVQEATLTFVPKLIGVGVVMALLGHWMLGTLVAFTQVCLQQASTVGRPVGM
jgi:flagellar biosynthetic protein FliQ